MNKKLLFSISIMIGILLIKAQPIAATGLGEWGYRTKYGTYFNGLDGPTFIMCKKQKIENVREWYYYKKRIIGNCGRHNKINSYFVLNEENCQIETFKDEKVWKQFLLSNNLKPWVWTRWYTIHEEIGLFILVLGTVALEFWYISFPNIIIFGWCFFKPLTLLVNRLGLPTYFIFVFFIGMILIMTFLENTVQSF